MKDSALINRFIAFLPEEFIMLGNGYYCTKIFYKEGRKYAIDRKEGDSKHVKKFKEDVEELQGKDSNSKKYYLIPEFPIFINSDLLNEICDELGVPKDDEIRTRTHYRIDYLVPFSKIFIEIDGSYHDSESSKLEDKVRDRSLSIVFGLEPLRFYQYGVIWKFFPGREKPLPVKNPEHEQQKEKLKETIESRYNEIPLHIDQTEEMIKILYKKYKKEIDVINLIEEHHKKGILQYDNNTRFKIHLKSVVPESKNSEKDKREIKNFFKKFFKDKNYDIEIL